LPGRQLSRLHQFSDDPPTAVDGSTVNRLEFPMASSHCGISVILHTDLVYSQMKHHWRPHAAGRFYKITQLEFPMASSHCGITRILLRCLESEYTCLLPRNCPNHYLS
jgi:hypothetical protein